MIINFIGNFNKGYVGEVSDLVHISRELKTLGHRVQEVPQDIYKGIVDGETPQKDWVDKSPLPFADITIITKWDRFDDGKYVNFVREITKRPVFYWCWDYMYYHGLPDWHERMVEAADIYLGNDVYSGWYQDHANIYYFPMDVCDGELPQYIYPESHKIYDVTFFGSHIDQGNRLDYLREINKKFPIKIFSWNYQNWIAEGFNAEEAVYGEKFNQKVAQSKIVLGLSVEPHCYGYWSNRVGKVLVAGGFLLYQYAPGMELFLRDGAEYFSSIEEAKEKIAYYLVRKEEREIIRHRGYSIGKDRFTSASRVKELMVFIERYLKEKGKDWQI